MNKLTLLASSILTSTLTLTACGGGSDSGSSKSSSVEAPPVKVTPEQQQPPSPEQPSKPEVTELNVLSGTVEDSSGNPLENATVKLGNRTIKTNKDGKYTFNIQSIASNDNSAVLLVKKTGYQTLLKEFYLIEGKAYTLDINLEADQYTELVESANFINTFLDSDVKIYNFFDSLDESIVNADGSAFNGTAKLSVNYYNPETTKGMLGLAKPLEGQDEDSDDISELTNAGMIEIKLTDANDASLNLKEDKQIELTFPQTLTDQNYTTIPLWYFDEEKMLWIEDGEAEQLEDGRYEARVSKTGLWAINIPLSKHSAVVNGCITGNDSNQAPSLFGAMIGGLGYINYINAEDGTFSISVPINTPLLLSPVEHMVDFNSVTIPALKRNEVFDINNGACIVTSKTDIDKQVNLSTQEIDFIEQVAGLPLIEKPALSYSAFKQPLIISLTQGDKIGYQFDFVMGSKNNPSDTSITDILLETFASYEDKQRPRFNDFTHFMQSLYGDNGQYVDDYKSWSSHVMTSNDLFSSYSKQGGYYSGPYIDSSSDEKIASYIENNAKFADNQLVRNYNDMLIVTTTYQDKNLSGQKISDVLFKNQPNYVVGTDIADSLDLLPESLNTFDSQASCKTLIAKHTNDDYIEYFDGNPQPLNYDYIEKPLVNTISGTWFPNNPIKWAAEKATNASGISRAVINYDNGTYDEGFYVRKNRLTVSSAEKQQCKIYNEEAKNQILEALSKITLPST